MKNKDLVEFNLNNKIWVKLTKAGIDHCRGYFMRYGGKSPFKLTTKEYVELQAWQFIEVFGPITHHGMHPAYQLTILIDKKDLQTK